MSSLLYYQPKQISTTNNTTHNHHHHLAAQSAHHEFNVNINLRLDDPRASPSPRMADPYYTAPSTSVFDSSSQQLPQLPERIKEPSVPDQKHQSFNSLMGLDEKDRARVSVACLVW